MDMRDKRLIQHQHKRETLAASLPVSRQIYWAEREYRIAFKQGRMLMAALAIHWLHKITHGGNHA